MAGTSASMTELELMDEPGLERGAESYRMFRTPYTC